MIIFVVFFLVAVLTIVAVFTRMMQSDSFVLASLGLSKQVYFTNEAALEDVVYRVVQGWSVDDIQRLEILPGTATTTVTHDSFNDTVLVRSISQIGNAKRVGVVELTLRPGTSFNYGVQTGNGGFRLGNSATIKGNVFSNGTIEGHNSAEIIGDAISAGPDGLISGLTVEGSSWSNTLQSAQVTGDAHYNVAVGSNAIGGSAITPFTVEDPVPLPLPDEFFDDWQTWIEENGTIIGGSDCSGGEYEINTNMFLGPAKIECDLSIRGTAGGTEITLRGPIWVEGNISVAQSTVFSTAASVGSRSILIVADNPTDRINSSKVTLNNSTEFNLTNNFVMLVSRNQSAALGGSEAAITVGQSVAGDVVLYTNEGSIVLGNRVEVVSITGFRIDVGNNIELEYKTGLSNVLFSGGPGGAYQVSRWYQE